MVLSLLLLVPGISFAAYEVIAHYYYHNIGMMTLSHMVRTWEGRSLLRKGGITLVLLVLFLHLVIMLF